MSGRSRLGAAVPLKAPQFQLDHGEIAQKLNGKMKASCGFEITSECYMDAKRAVQSVGTRQREADVGE